MLRENKKADKTALSEKGSIMDIRHKLIIPAAYTIIGMCGFYLSMYQISLLSISQTLKLSSFMMGAIVALQFAGLCLPPLFLGTLCEKIGRRGVVMISMPLIIFGTFLVSMTQGLAFFIIGIVFIGAGFSVTEGTLTATLGVEFSEHSTLHLGMSQAAFSLGAVISPFLCQTLMDAGWKYNALFGMVSAIFFVLFMLFIATKQLKDAKGVKEAGTGAALKFFKHGVFVFMSVAIAMYVATEELVSFFTDSFFKLTLNAPEFSALSLSLFWAGMIPTRMLLGVIKHRHKEVIIGCAAGIAVCIGVALLVPAMPIKTAAFCALGAFCGPCWPLIMDMAAKRYPQSAGTVSNVMISVGGIGGAVMPIVAGAFITGADFMPVFLVAMACAATMAGMLFLTRRERDAQQNT
jgi:FHS family glucose/mannose:H+ symporter-like MFS transporter